MMAQRIAAVVGGLVPGPDSPAEKQYAWRIRVGIAACVSLSGLLLFAAASLGAMPIVFPGFARSDSMQALAQSTLATQLLQLRKDQCRATTSEQRILYYRFMNEALEQYKALTGKEWQQPPCELLQ